SVLAATRCRLPTFCDSSPSGVSAPAEDATTVSANPNSIALGMRAICGEALGWCKRDTVTRSTLSQGPTPGLQRKVSTSSGLKRRPTPARPLHVGVIELEPRALQAVDIIDGRTRQVPSRERIDEHRHTELLRDEVLFTRHFGKIEEILQTRAAAA